VLSPKDFIHPFQVRLGRRIVSGHSQGDGVVEVEEADEGRIRDDTGLLGPSKGVVERGPGAFSVPAEEPLDAAERQDVEGSGLRACDQAGLPNPRSSLLES
jgi:hypothetical protein